jgi:ubiquitin-conjugating enzyme E2 D/E
MNGGSLGFAPASRAVRVAVLPALPCSRRAGLDTAFKPPKIKFVTPIYHCNVTKSGDICLGILKDQWAPSITISKVLESICTLLTDCNPDTPLSPDIAKQYQADRAEHDKTAKEWTQRFAV